MKVLIVEDDVDLLDLTTYALRREGYEIVAAIDGQQGLARWEAERPDIVLLDGNLPGLNGFEVCRRIRQAGDTPIVMLTTRDQEEDIIRGLQSGVDDYVTKPFSAKQFVAQMKAVLRRAQDGPYRQTTREVRAGDLLLDLQSHEATKGGRAVQLTMLEFKILYMLALNEGRVIPYSRLVKYAWGYDGGDVNLLKSHISHVRSKLGIGGDEPGGIRAVAGVGYSLARVGMPGVLLLDAGVVPRTPPGRQRHGEDQVAAAVEGTRLTANPAGLTLAPLEGEGVGMGERTADATMVGELLARLEAMQAQLDEQKAEIAQLERTATVPASTPVGVTTEPKVGRRGMLRKVLGATCRGRPRPRRPAGSCSTTRYGYRTTGTTPTAPSRRAGTTTW